jgi:hypothetical protein
MRVRALREKKEETEDTKEVTTAAMRKDMRMVEEERDDEVGAWLLMSSRVMKDDAGVDVSGRGAERAPGQRDEDGQARQPSVVSFPSGVP